MYGEQWGEYVFLFKGLNFLNGCQVVTTDN